MLKRATAAAFVFAVSAPAAPKGALEIERLGLFPAADYRLADGRCQDCPAPRQALWYFQEDVVAVPREAGTSLPSLVWIGSPQIVEHARLSADARRLVVGDGEVPWSLTEKLTTNRSYFDAHSAAFFEGRSLRLRGRSSADGGFVARTIWPEDFRLDRAAAKPTSSGETLEALVTAEDDGAMSPFVTRLLWERAPAAATWAGRPALAFVLSGAQGDDDEAHGGHFALATGTVGAGGEWADWMVNNFYNLDYVSEKGIVAARVPMDSYLTDLNRGQAYYRPNYVLTLILRQDRAARRYQEAIDAVYERFYRHDLPYHHSASNCTGISMDGVRGVGWNIGKRGPTSYAKATAAFFYLAATERSVEKGGKTFDYLVEEQTRLLPRVAFDEAGRDVLRLVRGERQPTTDYERTLKEDVEAVVFIRVPQIPSSRAAGTFPVGSFAEYQRRVPSDTSKWKIISIDARPFPDTLRDGPAPAASRSNALPVAAMTGIVTAGGLWGTARGVRRLFRRPTRVQ